jgi:ketosteroid isomerase-like protein
MGQARDVAVRFLEAFWRGDVPAALTLCAPDAVWTLQRTLREERRVPVPVAIDFLMTKLVSGFAPDSGYTVTFGNAIDDGEEAAVEYSAEGLTRNGATYRNDYLVRFTVRNGHIVSVRPYFDTHQVHRLLVPLD